MSFKTDRKEKQQKWLKNLLVGTVIGNKNERWTKISSTRMRHESGQVIPISKMEEDFFWVVRAANDQQQEEVEEWI